MPTSHSSIAIFYAFAANLGVAVVKAGAAIWTGSGALLAEAIHSFADCGNQVLLYIGMKRAKKKRPANILYGVWAGSLYLVDDGGFHIIFRGWYIFGL